MIVIADPGEMRSWSRRLRTAGRRIGFVPTMGCLHEGHLRLVDHAHRAADDVVLSVFVNPIQFGPTEDLASYPRDFERDRIAAERKGVACLFAPETASMYPTDPIVRVTPGTLAVHLCGPHRPGHFEGVLTVVAKLFNMVEPDVAVFGRKDVQQALIIRSMVEDLSFPVEVVVVPTVREPDGVAMSSRNAYLSRGERAAASRLSRGLEAAHRAFRSGTKESDRLTAEVREVAADPLIDIEYIEVVDPTTLAPIEVATDEAILAIAARLGKARLIDNIILADGTGTDETVTD